MSPADNVPAGPIEVELGVMGDPTTLTDDEKQQLETKVLALLRYMLDPSQPKPEWEAEVGAHEKAVVRG